MVFPSGILNDRRKGVDTSNVLVGVMGAITRKKDWASDSHERRGNFCCMGDGGGEGDVGMKDYACYQPLFFFLFLLFSDVDVD